MEDRATVPAGLSEHDLRDGLVLVTNDRDFVEYGEGMDHSGIIYTNQALSPGSFAAGVRRIDRQFPLSAMRNNVDWLDQWS